jgi:hypothetical protein
MSVRRRLTLLAVAVACSLVGASSTAASSSDPLCVGQYGGAPPHPGPAVRFGIDPGIAGSAGGVQLPTVPDDPARDLAAVRALRPPRRVLVLRLNRLFWSDGQAGISSFRQMVARYTRARFDVELQVRYHPTTSEVGDIPAWTNYVRHVVDVFGKNPRVVAMTITNEVNVTFSPNTSDGYYTGAKDALIAGVEAAHQEAARRRYHQLRFGFTYAYRFVPTADAAFFSYLGSHGGPRFLRALGFVGLDFYPGTIYPPVMVPGDTYRAELAQAAGVVRSCMAPLAGIGPRTPIWITENGVPTGVLSEEQQAAALDQLVQAVHDYAGTFNITDYRWFNLRDSNSTGPAAALPLTFSTDGLLRSDYTPKPSFGVYRSLIARFGARPPRGLKHPRSRQLHG